ncbi:CHAT domain-containing protein [Streptomyces viridiviolaceus]|uniref:CHAT domain-containing protein n=1 Tax=Streptomyces viridiviolaceus TaxID=68282 RepID=A0ABW2EAE6_9ACTN|nr:CHAT domain-containing protein [Streptomyces viridiviolaceus]GHB62030.1 CHAT domain-containing protein [Streptomyces viridiviolaceus]
MRDDRDRLVQAIRARVAGAGSAHTGVNPDVVFGPEADAELRGLLCLADLRTDLEARHAAGWLCAARAAASPGPDGPVHGAMAGTLLFPVWVADPGLVPPQLAAGYATTDPAVRPDPANADGVAEWSAQCAAAVIAAEGRQHDPPRDATEDDLRLYRLAVRVGIDAPTHEALLATAVATGSLAVLATPEHDPAYVPRVADLTHALSLVGRREPDADSGPAAGIRLSHRTLKRIPAHSPERLLALSNLGIQLLERYRQSLDPEDLYEAVGIARDVLTQLPPHSPHLAHCLSTLGAALLALRHREGATAEECDEVVDLFRRAAAGDPKGPAAAGLNLGLALMLRYQRTGRPQDLHEAVGVLTQAWEASQDGEQRTGVRNTLGNALRARFALTGDPADLDAAITHLTAVAAASAQATAETATRLIAPAMALHARYRLDPDGNSADLAEALTLLRRAEALLPPGHPERAVTLSDLGLVLTSSYQRTGRREELNEAVRVMREAVASTPEEHEILSVRLLNLGMALGLRHQLLGDGEDLREAQECRRRARELPGLGRAHRATVLGSTAISVMTGFERAADPDARLDEAIRLFREALALTPADDPLLPRRRHNLAAALMSRRDPAQRLIDAREARELADAVVAALPADSPDLPGALTLAAETRLLSFRSLVSSAVRKEAIALFRRVVEVTPPGHARRTLRLTNLGVVLRDQGTGRGRDTDLAEAADVFRQAALEQQCPPSERLTAARACGDLWAQLGVWDRALDGYVMAVDLLHSVTPRHLLRDDQEFLLSRSVGLGAAAAACAVRCGRPGLAVGLLEQARGVLLSQAFDADSDLTRLREAAPDLADRFEELRTALDTATESREPLSAEFPEEAPRDGARAADARADRRQRLAADWQELTRRIRTEHPGLGLLRPVREWDERELRATAAAGPVVLVNVSPYGSDALVVTEHSIDAVPLPGLDPGTTATRRQKFEEALARIESPGTPRRQAQRAQQVVRSTLAWLWQTVTGPVLDHLGVPAAPTGPWPRLWWSPGGALGTLPPHAAAPADGTSGALDRVVSSYTPTLRALHHARQRAARPAGTGTLVVGVAEAAGTAPLPGVRRESEHLAGLLPRAELLADSSATRSAVVSALPRHAYAHFACHALSDLRSPSDSRLILHDHAEHPLTVRDLARLRLPAARLAYLSACDTLRSSPELADEAVHVVSAFQMAGFPHVVGSLWHVVDAIGAETARNVYAALHTGNGALEVSRTAQALHTTVRSLRDTYPQTPSLWACQVHAGP